MTEDAATHALPILSSAEARALGCLIEKQATTPGVYPLTIKAAHAAANQKTAREPVMALDEGAVHHALRQLEGKGLAKQAFSSRAERYEQCATQALSLPQQQVVLIGLLLLRGAQTVHELLARSERMAKFGDADDLHHHLDRLIARQPSLVVQIPRGPGQREDRYMHLLCGPVDVAAVSARSVARATDAFNGAPELEVRVQALEEEVTTLREAIAQLQSLREADSA